MMVSPVGLGRAIRVLLRPLVMRTVVGCNVPGLRRCPALIRKVLSGWTRIMPRTWILCYGILVRLWTRMERTFRWSVGVGSPAGLPRVREKSGKILFFQGQGIVREFEIMSGKFWKGVNVREKSGNFMLGFWKVCCIIIFIHKSNLLSKCKLNFLTSWLIKWYPVVLVSCKSSNLT